MRNSARVKAAIIGGTGFKDMIKNAKKQLVRTPFGNASSLFKRNIEGEEVILLARHGFNHNVPPHKVNYRANMYALHKLKVRRILATNAVGAINCQFSPGDIIIPHDFVDFTKLRPSTFYDGPLVTHVDVSQPYCPELRRLLVRNSREAGFRVHDRAIMICTEGPRFETLAEIEMFRRSGGDIVGMTGFPEVVLARELEMCYASLCYVSNMAAGLQNRLTATDVSKISEEIHPRVEQILIRSIRALRHSAKRDCLCEKGLCEARFK